MPAAPVLHLVRLARLDVRKKDLPGIVPKPRPGFRTRLDLAVEHSSPGGSLQQVQFLWANVGALHVCLWTNTTTGAWVWGRETEELGDS